MKVLTRKTTTETLDEANRIINSTVSVVYLIYPDENKILVDKKSNKQIKGFVFITSQNDIKNYTEILKSN